MKNSLGIYIHVPFCTKKCPYCDFYSVVYDTALVEEYVLAICRDILLQSDTLRERYIIDTIYFGGGTPSLLHPDEISQIIDSISQNYSVTTDVEITMECNPNTVNFDKLQGYYNVGVNRISFGVQSLNEVELNSLGRTHGIKHCTDAVFDSVKAGFRNISIDLMLGTPYQTVDSVRETLKKAVSLPITHISAYMLKVEENTDYYTNAITEFCVDEDSVADIYLEMVDFFESVGFNQYEISNFSKQGCESRHNLKYWECKEYLGIGCSSHSYIDNIRYSNSGDVERYIKELSGDFDITDSRAGGIDEIIMLGLRLKKGIPVVKFQTLENFSATQFHHNINLLENLGYIKVEFDVIKLTAKGFLISNYIINKLLNN